MGIHRNYVNKKTHGSFLYIATNLKYGYTREHFSTYLITCNYKKGTMHIFILVVRFYSYKLSNMGIQGNENSFFTWDFKVVPNRFSWNLGFGPNDSISHYS